MTATRIIDDHLELANIGTNSHAQIDTHIAAADDYIKRDGSLALTSDWDIGDTRKVLADEIRARDGAGLKLHDDGGNGLFVADGGDIGIGVNTPAAILDIEGTVGSAGKSFLEIGGAGDVRFKINKYGNFYGLNGGFFEGAAGTAPHRGAVVATTSNLNERAISLKGVSGQVAGIFGVLDSLNNSLFVVDNDGSVGIITASPTAKLDVNSDILRLRIAKTPASAGAAGNTGDKAWDANYFYQCVSTNVWKRTRHSWDELYLKKDGSEILTSDWDIGDTRKVLADEIRARDGAGLKLYDDAGNGVFVEDGGNVGIGTITPDVKEQIVGDFKSGEDTTNYLALATDGLLSLHGTARVKKTVWTDAGAHRAPGSKPATFVESGLAGSWEFADAVAGNEESISGVWKIPADMDKTEIVEFKINWYANGISPGVCRWQLEYLWIAVGEDETAAAQETLTVDATASATSNGMCNATFTGVDAAAANDSGLFFKITRLSAHANDTISAVTLLRGRAIVYTSDKLGTGL